MSNDSPIPENNGAIFTIYQIIKEVMSSAAEAELRALFNCREDIPAHHTLEAMGMILNSCRRQAKSSSKK